MSSSDATANVREALAKLDTTVCELEVERARLVELLKSAHGAEADVLARGLKNLDEKLSEIRIKRDGLNARGHRVLRMQELAANIKAIRIELTELSESGNRGERYEALVRRARELQAEANRLRNSE